MIWGSVIALGIFLIISFSLVMVYQSYKSTLEDMHEVDQEQPMNKPEEAAPELVDPFIVLLYGIDKRQGTHDSGRPDTLMLALVDPQLLKVSLISIPRDSYVSIPGYTKKDKINSAYPRGGSQLTMQTIEEWFDTDIYAHVAIDFDGFIELVDLLGGIEVNVDRKISYDDPTDGTRIRLEKGLQVLDGKNALDFVRARLDNRGPNYYTSDYLRMERQQLVLKTLGREIVSFKSIPKVFEMMSVLGDNVSTSLTPKELDELVRTFYQFNISNLETTSVQGDGMQLNGGWYEDIPETEIERIKTVITNFINRETNVSEKESFSESK